MGQNEPSMVDNEKSNYMFLDPRSVEVSASPKFAFSVICTVVKVAGRMGLRSTIESSNY